MSNSESPEVPGFYGKFPELGDFVNRRIPKSFLEPWDFWLQGVVAASKEELGDNWLDYYLTSPIWRFILTSNVCSESAWGGVIMPSVDRVGRYFPLTLTVKLPLSFYPPSLVSKSEQWFAEAEGVILKALDSHQFDLEEFDNKVVALGMPILSCAKLDLASSVGFGTSWQIPLSEVQPDDGLNVVLHHALTQRLGEYSFWWGGGSERVTSSILITEGLPNSTQFTAMLTGDWIKGGWDSWGTDSG